MDSSLTQEVRARAGKACEYCCLPDSVQDIFFEIEHVVPEQHGGATVLSNLAYSCLH